MTRSPFARITPVRLGLATLALAALTVTGCSAAEDAADDAANAAKSQAAAQASKAAQAAKSKAAQQAREAAKDQICALVGDGALSAPDLAALRGLVSGARRLGVPAQLLTPVQQLVDSGDTQGKQVADRLTKAKAACR